MGTQEVSKGYLFLGRSSSISKGCVNFLSNRKHRSESDKEEDSVEHGSNYGSEKERTKNEVP